MCHGDCGRLVDPLLAGKFCGSRPLFALLGDLSRYLAFVVDIGTYSVQVRAGCHGIAPCCVTGRNKFPPGRILLLAPCAWLLSAISMHKGSDPLSLLQE